MWHILYMFKYLRIAFSLTSFDSLKIVYFKSSFFSTITIVYLNISLYIANNDVHS